MSHEKTIENFLTMQQHFGKFEFSADTGKQLAAAITDLKNSNDNLTDRNALLRQRPDLPVDRIPAHTELVRLMALEKSLLDENPWQSGGVDADELSIPLVTKWQEENGGMMSRAQFAGLCSLALHAMQTYRDEHGRMWTTPTPYSYAKVFAGFWKQAHRADSLENDVLKLRKQVSQLEAELKKTANNG